MTPKGIVAVDPSGSFNEGKGKTGLAYSLDNNDSVEVISIEAKDYPNRHAYWNSILCHILGRFPDVVVIENFVTRANGFLIGKMPETPMLIGMLVWEFEKLGIPYIFQSPSQAKTRFKDDYLGRYILNYEVRHTTAGKKLYYLDGKLTNDHVRDAIKHLIYYKKYNKGE